MKRLGISVLMVMLGLISSPTTFAASQHAPVELEFLATSAGTSAYLGAAAAADIINKNIPWIKLSLTATLGTDQNIIVGLKKDPKRVLIQCAEGSYLLATLGLPPFEKKVDRVKYIANYCSSYIFWGTLDSNIKTAKDFVGKRIAIPPVAQFNGKIGEWFLQEQGMIDKVKVSRMDFTASADAMKDGLVDVIVVSVTGSSGPTSPPTPHLKDLMETRGDRIHYIPWDHATLSKVEKTQGMKLGKAVVPAGTLGPRQPEPVECFVMGTTGHAAFDGADPDVIYEFTKTIATNYMQLRTYHPSLKDVTPKSMVENLPISSEREISPGALKYYKETGLWPIKK